MTVFIHPEKTEPKCSDCIYFNYDEIYVPGEDEIELFDCEKGHIDHIGWNQKPCEDFREQNNSYHE